MQGRAYANKDNPKWRRLLELLKKLSYKEGDFTLASGRKSDYYLDCRNTALHPEGITLIGSLFYETLTEIEKESGLSVAAAGGMTLGAAPLAASVAIEAWTNHKRELYAFIVRKEEKQHGAGGMVVGAPNIPKGSNVVILEDVVTTAGSALKAYNRCKEEGFNPIAAITIVDRNEGGKEELESAGLPLYSLFVRDDFRNK